MHNMTHLRPTERALFTRFLRANPFPDARYDFDVHLGDGMPINPNWPPWIADMARSLTQRRVDVIARLANDIWILEIKPRAGTSAVGQLLTYRQLYMDQFRPPRLPLLGIIAQRDGFDMSTTYEEFDITLFLV